MDKLQWAKGQLDRAEQLKTDGKYEEVIKICEEIAPVFEAAGEWRCYYYRSMKLIGESYNNLMRFEEAKNLLGKMIDALPKETILCKYHGDLYYELGTTNVSLGEYSNAISLFNRGKQISEEVNDSDLEDSVYHNNVAVCYCHVGRYDKAAQEAEKALDMRQNMPKPDMAQIATAMHNLAGIYSIMGNYRLAQKYFNEVLEIRKQIFPDNHPEIASVFNSISYAYGKEGDVEKQLHYCLQALDLHYKRFGKVPHVDAGIYLNNVGYCYGELGQYERQLHHYKKSLEHKLAIFGDTHMEVAIIYNNIGGCYDFLGDTEASLFYYKSALKINEQLSEPNPFYLSYTLSNLSAAYFKRGEYEKSEPLTHAALETRLANLPEIHPDIAFSYNQLGKISHAKGEYRKAIQNHHIAICSVFESCEKNNVYGLPVLGEVFLTEGLHSLHYKSQAFLQYHQNETRSCLDLLAARHTYRLAAQIIDRMRSSYQADASKLVLAKKAKPIYGEAIEVEFLAAREYRGRPGEMEAAFTQLQAANPAHRLPPPGGDATAAAFAYSEKCKAAVLLGNLKDGQARIEAGIPKELLDEEYDLRVEIGYLEKRINEEKYKTPEDGAGAGGIESGQVLEWRGKMFDCKQDYERLTKRFEREYPEYHSLKYQTEAVSPSEVQAALGRGECLLEYFVGERHIFAFAFAKNGRLSLQLEKPGGFEDHLGKFVEEGIKQMDKAVFLKFGHELHTTLLAPFQAFLQANKIGRLTLIPDGALARLPFEALLTGQPGKGAKYPDLPYLVKEYSVAYHFSATLWHRQRRQKAGRGQGDAIDGFVGFAPVYAEKLQNKASHNPAPDVAGGAAELLPARKSPRRKSNAEAASGATRSMSIGSDDCVSLPHSETEVLTVEAAFGQAGKPAKSLLHEAATSANFKKYAGRYKYVLVAAHADFREDAPELTGLLFSPDGSGGDTPLFYLLDAYALRLSADLIVLSCCDSGVGKEAVGEGVIALNRGFLYAGAKNVVFTLFKVPDLESGRLSQSMFGFILQGETYRESLRLAKLRLISEGLRPNKWAGYILIGE